MKQVSLALIEHQSAKGVFPPGCWNAIDGPGNPQNGRCWMHDVLPFLEEGELYEQFVTYMIENPNSAAAYFPQNIVIVPALMCPDDPLSPKLNSFNYGGGNGNGAVNSQGFHGNMVTCAGNGYFNPSPSNNTAEGIANSTDPTKMTGIMFGMSTTRPKSITDGLSHTALVSEIILSPDTVDNDCRGRYYNPTHCGVLFSALYTPNTAVADIVNWCSANPIPQAPCIAWQNYGQANLHMSARSYHPGGVNLSFADGSVQFIGDEISPTLYQALSTRNGNEVTGTSL